MRHRKHRNQLGVKKEHREAVMAHLAGALIRHGRIETTLKKAKALRPFAEKLVTLAKKGDLHRRRLVAARLKGDKDAVRILFNERATEFTKRPGGYTRIYKLAPRRIGDAAEMALIEWVKADDAGYKKTRKGKAAKAEAAPEAPAEAAPAPAAAPATATATA